MDKEDKFILWVLSEQDEPCRKWICIYILTMISRKAFLICDYLQLSHQRSFLFFYRWPCGHLLCFHGVLVGVGTFPQLRRTLVVKISTSLLLGCLRVHQILLHVCRWFFSKWPLWKNTVCPILGRFNRLHHLSKECLARLLTFVYKNDGF